MNWKLDKSRPVCPQITEQLCMLIATDSFQPNEKLMSVREVALAAGVNPNTVQKAFEQLEAKGLIYSQRGSGWFVGDNKAAAEAEVTKLLHDKIKLFFDDMRSLGFTDEAIKEYIKEWTE